PTTILLEELFQSRCRDSAIGKNEASFCVRQERACFNPQVLNSVTKLYILAYIYPALSKNA
ncbi:hypothetical protein, partial [Kamptonema formosum]|uniref:hypothetical protein n=1 Tax=Kamptonema formosum TaxID=331992 RepID=UPI001E4CE757